MKKKKKLKKTQQTTKFRKLKKKVCQFCVDKTEPIDYKNALKYRKFISERGKIFAKRITGVCSKHQRKLTQAIKRARFLALLPYTVE